MEELWDGGPRLGVPPMEPVTLATLRLALTRGWADLRRAPLWGVGFAGICVAIGWILAAVTLASGQSYWLIFAALSFPLAGPFTAVGLYEVSRRLQRGQPLEARAILTVVLRQSHRQLPSLCAIIIFVLLFWFFLGHMIFALFLGLSVMTNVSSSAEVFLTPRGLAMLGFGGVVGAGFALLLYMITVIALPLLLDREVDFVTAMITSFGTVTANPGPMLTWGLGIAALTFLALIPGFLGLFLVLPWLGHATWHLYDLTAGRGG